MPGIKQQLTRISPLSVTLIVLFAAAMTYFIIGAFAATGPATLYTSPGGTQSVTTGQSFTVNVRISTGGNVPVTGASVYLSYPTSKLQMTGQNYAGSPYSTQLLASDSGGVLRMDRAAFPAIAGGDQLFAQVSFKALAAGSAPITFTGSSVVTSGEDDSNILSQRNGVTYNIAAPATPPPASGGSSGGSSGSGGTSSGSSSSGGSTRPSTGGSSSGGSGSSSSGGSSSGGSSSSGSSPGSGSSGSGGTSGSSTGDNTTTGGTTTASTINVTIVDSNNKPVAGAQVTIGGQTVKTDKNGIAHFTNVPTGNQAITVKYNGKKTSKTLQVKNTASTQSPQLFKVSVTRSKFNPVLLILPVVILAAAAIFFLRPWDKKFAPAMAKDETPPVVSSSQPPVTPGAPAGRKLETPGTVYSPTPSGDDKQPPTPKVG